MVAKNMKTTGNNSSYNGPDDSAEKIVTYFYAFTGPGSERKKKTGSNLDALLEEALTRLDGEFSDCSVTISPKKYHDLRNVFGISDLPAFGISDIKIEARPHHGESPPNLPHMAKLWRWKDRNKILRSGRILPKVERDIISHLTKEPENLFFFIRDLHIAGVDEGITGVLIKIEQALRSFGLKNLISTISSGKKQFFG